MEPCQSEAHAFHADFHIDARDWMLIGKKDSNMQLEYYFGYTVGSTTVYLSATYSTANEVGSARVCNKIWCLITLYCVLLNMDICQHLGLFVDKWKNCQSIFKIARHIKISRLQQMNQKRQFALCIL